MNVSMPAFLQRPANLATICSRRAFQNPIPNFRLIFFLSKAHLDRNDKQYLMLCRTKLSFFMNIYQTQYFKQAADLSESKSKYCHRQTCLRTGKHPILSFECNLKVQSERTRSETILAQGKEIFSTSSICSSQTVL
jgi:hypothetical protein